MSPEEVSGCMMRNNKLYLSNVNKDGNWQVCMHCIHVRKGTSEAPRTHFRVCKISKFPGGVPQDPFTQTIV